MRAIVRKARVMAAIKPQVSGAFRPGWAPSATSTVFAPYPHFHRIEPVLSGTAMAHLDARSKILLKTLVERYIAEGQPVGSRALSRYSGLELSPATVRNVMSDLEEMGYIASPHTSAGRIPTPLGYRLFVDSLLTTQPIDTGRLRELKGQLQPDQPQRLMNSASHLLSELTQF